MSVMEMAKAHLQNVVQRIEELTKQQGLIQKEIEQLKVYVDDGVKNIQVFEKDTSNKGK
jgi:hypothetical protein